jgi:enoyl-CoA hydratase/carnithine racemase
MSYETIKYEVTGPVAIITLNRPEKLNAWLPKMSAEKIDALDKANADPNVGAVIITGEGRAFCAGADIKQAFNADLEAAEKGGATRERTRDQAAGVDWVGAVRRAKPVIAAINGIAVGVGITMVLPADILIASEDAQIGMFFVKMGLVPELGSSHYLVQRIGFGKAHEMCLTARLYDAQECGAMGLVDHVVPADALMAKAMELAEQISQNPSPQMRMVKQLLDANGCDPDISAVQGREGDALVECRTLPEHKEAVSAFMEGRKPDFKAVAQ